MLAITKDRQILSLVLVPVAQQQCHPIQVASHGESRNHMAQWSLRERRKVSLCRLENLTRPAFLIPCLNPLPLERVRTGAKVKTGVRAIPREGLYQIQSGIRPHKV